MIRLSNGHRFEYMIASGALGFHGLGWPWEVPLVEAGLIKPELFTTVIKTLTLNPREGNLKMHKPWNCVKLIPGGAVNKVGLTNPGVDWWCEKVAPTIDFDKYSIVGSIYGSRDELVECAWHMNKFPLVAQEVNLSCPNSGDPLAVVESAVGDVVAVKKVSRHPLITKLSAAQDVVSIARALVGIADAVSLNTVPWEMAFPGKRSPLYKLEKRVGGGGGGVSGRPAQKLNWAAVQKIRMNVPDMPIIGPDVMEYEDMERVRACGAKAVSFGTIHLPSYPIALKPWTLFANPCLPTKFVEREKAADEIIRSLD